jgi:uncharacterized protein YndB with AHSA1/START domain
MTTSPTRRLEGTTDVVLDAPPSDVFAALTDVDRLPTWNEHITRVLDAPDGPLAEGAEWVVLITAMGTSWRSRTHLSVYDPIGYRFEYESRTDDGNPSWAAWRWLVLPLPDGRSRVSVAWSVNPRTFWRRVIFSKIRRSQLTREVPASLAALTRSLEAARPAT